MRPFYRNMAIALGTVLCAAFAQCATVKVPIRFSVEGPGEIVATDNGDETDFDDFRIPQRKTFNGWAQAIVRAKPGVAGTIRVTVSSDGPSPLAAAAAELRASSRNGKKVD